MNEKETLGYESPRVDIIEVEIERGFASSDISGWGDGGEHEDFFGVNF